MRYTCCALWYAVCAVYAVYAGWSTHACCATATDACFVYPHAHASPLVTGVANSELGPEGTALPHQVVLSPSLNPWPRGVTKHFPIFAAVPPAIDIELVPLLLAVGRALCNGNFCAHNCIRVALCFEVHMRYMIRQAARIRCILHTGCDIHCCRICHNSIIVKLRENECHLISSFHIGTG